MDKTLKFRHQRSADDTLECFDSWILLTMLASIDMASQEAYEPARYLSACDQSRARNRTRALFSELIFSVSELASSVLCVRAFSRWSSA